MGSRTLRRDFIGGLFARFRVVRPILSRLPSIRPTDVPWLSTVPDEMASWLRADDVIR